MLEVELQEKQLKHISETMLDMFSEYEFTYLEALGSLEVIKMEIVKPDTNDRRD